MRFQSTFLTKQRRAQITVRVRKPRRGAVRHIEAIRLLRYPGRMDNFGVRTAIAMAALTAILLALLLLER